MRHYKKLSPVPARLPLGADACELRSLIAQKAHARILPSEMRTATVGTTMPRSLYPLLVCVGLCWGLSSPAPGWTKDLLPAEPELNTRLDELYDHEARLFIMLYSLKGDGRVDYVTARLVREYSRNGYGNPVYQTEAQPLFYWWNHIMWNDPEQDGVNGNERVYLEGVDFDISRYKPCVFNGQAC